MNSHSIRTFRPLLLALVLASAGVAGTAHAADSAAVPRKQVDFGDLDLSRPAGAEALYRRLHAAAVSVCGDVDTRDLQSRAHRAICREQAMARAVAGIGNPSFAAWYESRKQRPADGQLVAGTR